MWFSKATWDDFENLRTNGNLLAPTPDRQTHDFEAMRLVVRLPDGIYVSMDSVHTKHEPLDRAQAPDIPQ